MSCSLMSAHVEKREAGRISDDHDSLYLTEETK